MNGSRQMSSTLEVRIVLKSFFLHCVDQKKYRKYEIKSKAKTMGLVLTKLTAQLSSYSKFCELVFAVDDSYHIFCRS